MREVETAQLCRIQLHTDGEERLVSESAQACIGVTRYDYKIDFFFLACRILLLTGITLEFFL